ncbi:MAG TPA: ATP-binding cassette domain-containing protein [Acidimicrobiia bacterium]|nr:ATP-binding cassette domain-containing protein [Acidimicrobiia bacterium]
MTLLEARAVTKRFAGITAVDEVSLTVEPGEAVALIGPNGAGKTTFFNCLLGMLRPDGGRVVFDGRDITRAPVYKRARLGLGRTFQRIELFRGMTVREHLQVAEWARVRAGRLWRDCLNLSQPSDEQRARVDRMLELLDLGDVADRPVDSLSLGRGRLVELGRTLMTEPSLLLLDEPSSGLDQRETQEMVGALQEVQRQSNTAVLLVEHDVAMVQAFASRLYVLDFGRLIAQGETADVLRDDEVRKAYLGELTVVGPDAAAPTRPKAPDPTDDDQRSGTPLLDVRGVDAGYGPFRALFGVSFTVEEGGVTAMLGANGAGKTTIARVISGLIPATAGHIVFDGVDITRMKPWRIAPLGIVHAPEGRSVFGSLTVEENLTLDFRRNLGRGGVAAGLERAYDLFPRVGERRKQLAGTLSGGEQRMLSLARVLVRAPRLLIVDELSLGLAPLIVDEVYATLDRVRQEGTTLLLIEQYVGHALNLADGVVLLQHGEVVYDGPATALGDVSERLLSSHG